MEAATAASEAKKVKTEGEPQAQENGKKRKGRARKKESVDDSEDNDEEQEDCSAKPKCSRPVGKVVNPLSRLDSSTIIKSEPYYKKLVEMKE